MKYFVHFNSSENFEENIFFVKFQNVKKFGKSFFQTLDLSP